VEKNLMDSPQDRLLHGSAPLHRFGTAEDIPILYERHDSPSVHERANGLMAISRILNLGFRYSNDDAFQAHEALWQDQVKEALLPGPPAPTFPRVAPHFQKRRDGDGWVF
jgi:hypothetical protein